MKAQQDCERMKISWRIETATAAHIPHIAANMREADRREIWASDRQTPEEALTRSFALSVMCRTCVINGSPAFMWGVTRRGSILSDTGVPWLLGTNAITAVRRAFIKQSRAYVEMMQQPFARLENIVHSENALSIRWLAWCGFTIEKEPVERNGETFFPFWRVAACA
ncbi:MAG: hypothetical protein DELT_01728 [Desulfovibrio sp.]